jgi:hypothetical protein
MPMRSSSYISTFVRLTAVALIASAPMGCASNSELAKVRTEAHDAQRTADQALTVAQEANSRSQRTEEMVNRGFRHSMRK